MPESDLHIVIAKFLQPIRLAKKRESPANSFRIDRQQFIAIQHIVGILLTGDDAAQLCMKVEKKRKLDQARMNQKPRVAFHFVDNRVQRHHRVPRHETTMDSDEYRGTFARHVFQSSVFDAPIMLVQKIEKRPAVRRDVLLVHSEIIELVGGHRLISRFAILCQHEVA